MGLGPEEDPLALRDGDAAGHGGIAEGPGGVGCNTIKPMSDFKPRPGTFRPYLEYTNREKPARPSPITLLEILARQDRPTLPLFELQTLSGMEPSPYGEALKSLRDAGYIAIEGEAPEQVVRLTGGGSAVVLLARPAYPLAPLTPAQVTGAIASSAVAVSPTALLVPGTGPAGALPTFTLAGAISSVAQVQVQAGATSSVVNLDAELVPR